MEGVTIVSHPLVQHKLTLLRSKDTSTKSFRELLKEIGMLLCYEVTRDLPLADVEIETPLAKMRSPEISGKKLVFAPVLRAGVTFADGMLDLVPTARVAHIGLYREPETFTAVEYFFKAPSDLHERLVIVVSPVLATANLSVAAVDRLKERGANYQELGRMGGEVTKARHGSEHYSEIGRKGGRNGRGATKRGSGRRKTEGA